MPRLLGVDIPNDRPTVISLTYLYGVGPKTARELCHKAGVNPQAQRLEEDYHLPALGRERVHVHRRAACCVRGVLLALREEGRSG